MATQTLTALAAPFETVRMRYRPAQAALAVAFGVALTLCMQGYFFGKSNHTVYLIDALRRVHPELLANDWFATQTLQYHAAFGVITRWLMGVGLLESGFLIGYAALLVLFHIAWWRLVRTLGGGVGTFVISEMLFHLSLGGTALGLYQFLQDGSFLPSNIAAVALLWGIVLWLRKRVVTAGVCFGIAGLFHLNYALVGVALWGLLHLCQLHRGGPRVRSLLQPRALLATAVATLPSIVNIALALHVMRQRSGAMPLAEFVDLYVRLRHPHHYDPMSWNVWVWISFVWPIPLAVLMWRRLRRTHRVTYPWREAAKVFFIFALMLLVALIGAGVTFLSESLIQASLFRFSIYVKLLSCIAGGMWIYETAGERTDDRVAPLGAAGVGVLVLVLCIWRGPYLGLFRMPDDEARYEEAADWVRHNTPPDAVFLVPPHEQAFRLRAQRAIIVNFKGVPQLSGELGEWRDRLQNVLDLPDLRVLPGPFAQTLAAMRDRYDVLPPAHLEKVARQYGARYVVVGHSLGLKWEPRRVDPGGNPMWFLYDLSR